MNFEMGDSVSKISIQNLSGMLQKASLSGISKIIGKDIQISLKSILTQRRSQVQ